MRPIRPVIWIPIATLVSNLACGTLLYPERRDREKPDHVDAVVVLMDGALLFVFLIPGVIAFAVDIATGAIYEPEGRDWALQEDGTPVRMTAAQAEALQVQLPDDRMILRVGGVWWERADGERVLTRIVASGRAGRYRLESRSPLAPGLHRLVVAAVDGRERKIPVTILTPAGDPAGDEGSAARRHGARGDGDPA